MLLNIHTCCVGNYINVHTLSGGMKRWENWVLGGLGWEEGGLVLSGFSTGRVGSELLHLIEGGASCFNA